MSHVRVTHPGHPHGGTRLELDGIEVKGITGLQLNFPTDGLAECHLGILVENRPLIDQEIFEFEAPMDVHLHLHVPEGCTVIDVTTMSDAGKRRFLVTRRAEEGR